MMPDFLLYALVAGTLIALIAGPLGCFVVWRRMAYFGAAVSHSALLGVALSLFLGGLLLETTVDEGLARQTGYFLIEEPMPVVLLLCLLLAVLLWMLQRRHLLASDTLLGIVAHGSLALGLLLVALMQGLRVDLMGYLFGDILSVSGGELMAMLVLTVLVLLAIVLNWTGLLSATVNPELAAVEGVRVKRLDLILVLMLACVVAMGMRMVGVLLIISMLIIPPATVRYWVSTPKQMALSATAAGVLEVWVGLALSWWLDLPAGPAIVAVATGLFVLSMMMPRRAC